MDCPCLIQAMWVLIILERGHQAFLINLCHNPSTLRDTLISPAFVLVEICQGLD